MEKQPQDQYPAIPPQGSAKIEKGIKISRFQPLWFILAKKSHPITGEKEIYFV